MKLLVALTVWSSSLLALPIQLIAQRAKSTRTRPDCSQPLLTQLDQALSDSLQRYLKFVGDYEIPVIVRQVTEGETHYYLTAFMATYRIKQNPPSNLVQVNGREALFYEAGKPESIETTAPACWQYLLSKYSYLLHIDKMNRRNKLRPSSPDDGYLYDPVSIDIVVSGQGGIKMRPAFDIPLLKWE